MAVPETAVNPYHSVVLPKDYIWLGGQIGVQSKTKTAFVKIFSDNYFRLGIL